MSILLPLLLLLLLAPAFASPLFSLSLPLPASEFVLALDDALLDGLECFCRLGGLASSSVAPVCLAPRDRCK